MQEKYEKLFFELKPEETKWGDWCLSPQMYFRGSRDIPESTMNVGYQVIMKSVKLLDDPRFHTFYENILFL